MNIYYQDVMYRLKEERKRLGWTQETLAERLYMSQGHYSKAESGQKHFTHRQLQLLAEAGLDLHYVYTGEKITHPERYQFFLSGDKEEMQCLAEMALSLIAYRSRELPPEKTVYIQERIRYTQCILLLKRQKDGCLLQLRRYMSYNQKHMAGLLGVDIKKYGFLEQGKKACDSEVVLRIYNCFHISPLLLVNGERGLAREVCALLDQLDSQVGQDIFDYMKK